MIAKIVVSNKRNIILVEAETMSSISIELIILDFRHFLDEALMFLECFESSEQAGAAFHTNQQELAELRQYAIEFIRLVYDLKKLFQTGRLVDEFNVEIEFSEQFKNKRIFFYTNLFKRLEALSMRIYDRRSLSTELVKLYFRTIQKLVRNSNEFVGYLESHRWNRDIAFQILDKLVEQANDFLCIFEKVLFEIGNQFFYLLVGQ